MTTWTNELDVFRDLDRLSGFSKRNVAYPALHAFGRGKMIVKEDRNGRKTKVAQFSPPPKIPEAQSFTEVEVPCKMDDDTIWERDRDLYFQLRQVCPRGHSNQLIEEEFGQSEWHRAQVNELDSDLPVENFLAEDSNKLIISDSELTTLTLNESASPQLQSSSKELVLPGVKDSRTRLFVHPPKLKPSRNALLNSLARRKILQLPDESNMIAPPITCNGGRTDCMTEDVIYNHTLSLDAKLLEGEFGAEPSHFATKDILATPNVDSQKTEVESMKICDQEQAYRETQKQYINWSDIRKFKASCHSPGSTYSDGTPRSSPIHSANSYTPQKSRRHSKVKSVPVTNVDLAGLSASSNSLGEESDSSEWKQYDKAQDVSHQSLGVQYKSKDERTKDYWCSLPSSPTNTVTPDEKLSWCALRKNSSHPKNVMLSDYIETTYSLELVPTQNFPEIPCPPKNELRKCDELHLNSVKDFPPLQ